MHTRTSIAAIIVGLVIIGIAVGFVFESFSPEQGQTVMVTDEALTTNAAVQTDIPESIPVYPKSTPEASYQTDDGSGFVLEFSTADPVPTVASYYQTQLPSVGWEMEEAVTRADTVVLQVTKGSQSGVVSIAKVDEKTVVSVVIGDSQ